MADISSMLLFGRPVSSYAIVAVMLIAIVVLRVTMVRIVRRKAKDGDEAKAGRYAAVDMVVRRFVMPSLYVGALAATIAILNVGGSMKAVAIQAMIGLAVFFGARLLSSLLSMYFGSREREEEESSIEGVPRIKPLVGFLKALVWLVASLFYLENLGIKMSSVVAGLGISGIAVALAAQSILGDLFSYFIIYFDRPFNEGDFIVFDDISGVVERIGMKTTKIRALSGEQIVVSNSALTGSRIRNFKRMERRRVVFAIGILYETELALVEAVPGIIREAVLSAPMTEFDRAHLKGFGSSSLDFECVYYLSTPDYVQFMDSQQAVLLRVLEEFAARGIEIAYPTTKVHLAGRG